MNILASTSLLAATVTTGLTAGLLYAFAHSVMPGLGTLDDPAYLTAFRRVDAAIANPWMGVAFVGSPILTLAAGALMLREGGTALVWVTVALVLIVATVAVTAVVHLPLNAAVRAAAPAFAEAADLRRAFEARWVTWNWVRTLTSACSLAALCGALLTAHHH